MGDASASTGRGSAELQLLDLLGAELDRLRLATAGRRRDGMQGALPMLAVLALHLDGLGDCRRRHGDATVQAVPPLVAARLAARLRVGDCTFGLVADAATPSAWTAAGGGCLLSNVASVQLACAIAERLRRHLGSPWRIGPARLSLRASIGVAVGPAADLTRLLGEAMRALQGARVQPGGLLPFRPAGAGRGPSTAGR